MAIAKLSIDFEARLGQFESELKRITSVADGVSSRLTDAFKGIGLAMAGLGAGVGLATLKDKFDQAIASAAGLKEMADKTGASVENLSGLGAVAKITATDMGLVEQAMNKLSKGLHASDEDAKGVGKALDFLGLKMKDLRGKDSAENLKLVADKMAELEDGTGKVALAMALFGKGGASMLAFMKDLAASGELQIKTTEAQAVAAKNFEEDLRRLAVTKEALYKVVSLELAPAFDTFVRALIGARNETNGMLQTGKDLAADGSIREWGLRAVEVAGFVIDAFDGVGRTFKGIGITLGAAAAQAAALASGDLAGYKNIRDEWRADRDELINKPLFSQKLQVQTDALRAHWAQVEAVKKAYASFPKDIQNKALKSLEESFYGTAGGSRSASGFTAAADPRNAKTGAGSAKVDDYTKLIQSLNEKIAVEQLNIDTVGLASKAEKDYAKYQADVASGAVKLTAEQQRVIEAYYQTYIARQKSAESAAGLNKGIAEQTEYMRKQQEALGDQVRRLEDEAKLYGLTERSLASVTVSRLEDAIAMARQNGAGEEQIAYLEKELELRKQISDATETKATAAILSQTDDAKRKKLEADKALLDRKLASGDITQREYDQGLKVIEGSVSEMDEFMKSAAKNMQSAFADFLFDPFAEGAGKMAQKFGETVQRMIAEAASAQLARSLFGDMGKTGEVGGLVGTAFAALKGVLPSFDVGTDYVPRDMVARIHEGEAIIPKAQNKRGMQGGGAFSLTQHFHGQTDARTVKRAGAAALREVQALMANSARVA